MTSEKSAGGNTWSGNTQLCELDFTDDITLIGDSWSTTKRSMFYL